MANKVIKSIKKVAEDVANEGKHQIHHIERNLSINKAKKQKLSHKQKAIKLLHRGIKDLNSYKDRQGIVGEVANEMIVDIEAIIENAHGNTMNDYLIGLGRSLQEKLLEENQRHSESEMLQTRKMENSELKIIYGMTNDICKAFCEMLE